MFSDFLRYLHACVCQYIQETHANGTDLWPSLEKNIQYILSHPNGWEGAQQGLMRKAAIMAGLISDKVADRSRLAFVTEGEASLHFCIQSEPIMKAIKVFENFLVCNYS